MPIGKWAIIDIETTGVNPLDDQIIEIGFIAFDGLKLVKKYQSLVNYNGKLSQFIQKLTGIKQKMLRYAPILDDVLDHLLDLEGYRLVAHNSSFEEGFLKQFFDEVKNSDTLFIDSIPFLGLLNPGRSPLSLESFIFDFKIAEKEEHRAYEDSRDLLKVMLLTVYLSYKDMPQRLFLEEKLVVLQDWWFTSFYSLTQNEILEIAEQIEFDLLACIKLINDVRNSKDEVVNNKIFDLDFTSSDIENFFQDEENIRTQLRQYEYRESQQILARKLGQSFSHQVHALIQAPTGTGKTLGYLLSAVLFSIKKKQQVLIATGTKTLQNQLLTKDIPLIKKLLGLKGNDLSVELLIGANNHYCEAIYREKMQSEGLFNEAEGVQQRYSDLYWALIFFKNSQEQFITRGNIPYVLRKMFNSFTENDSLYAVDYRVCTGKKCPFKSNCSYLTGLRKAKSASIIVGNHALMFMWPRSLPRPEYVIVDEAHRIENEATSSFTITASNEQFEGILKSLEHMQGVGALFYLLGKEKSKSDNIAEIRESVQLIKQKLTDQYIDLPDLFEKYFIRSSKYSSKFWNELPMITEEEANNATSISIYNRLLSLKTNLDELYLLLVPYISKWDVQSLDDDNDLMAYTRFEAFVEQVSDVVNAIVIVLDEKDKEFCKSIKYHEKLGFSLDSSPIDVGKIVLNKLLDISKSVVFVSATLANDKGNFGVKGIEWPTGYLFIPPEKRYKSGFFLPAVFNYQDNAKVILCDDTLKLFDANFVEECLRPVIKLIRKLEGRSLLLFSARSRFEQAREVLLDAFEGEIPVFIQGMGINVVEEYKKSSCGILLGMESFGEGIDIPGDGLQFIFIDKIPDLRMDLVINQRRQFFEKNFGNEFQEYYLANRTRKLHQKLGRLLRTEQDRGGIIIVDSRIKNWKERSRKSFYSLMAPYKIENMGLEAACDEVYNFIEES